MLRSEAGAKLPFRRAGTSFAIDINAHREPVDLWAPRPHKRGNRAMSKTVARTLGVLLALTLVGAACGVDDDESSSRDPRPPPPRRSTTRPSACGTTARVTRRAAAEDRAYDRFRVAGALTEGPGAALDAAAKRSTHVAARTARASRSRPATTAATSTKPWRACGRSTLRASWRR